MNKTVIAFIKVAIPNLFSEKNKSIFRKEIAEIIEEALQMPTQGVIASLEGMKIRKNKIKVLQKNTFKKIQGRKTSEVDSTGEDIDVESYIDFKNTHCL